MSVHIRSHNLRLWAPVHIDMDLSETSLTSQLYFHSETGNLSKSTRYIFSYPLQKVNDWTVVGLAQEMAEMYSIFDKLFSRDQLKYSPPIAKKVGVVTEVMWPQARWVGVATEVM